MRRFKAYYSLSSPLRISIIMFLNKHEYILVYDYSSVYGHSRHVVGNSHSALISLSSINSNIYTAKVNE